MKEQVEGIIIDYQLKQGFSSRFNQKMFGRISNRKTPDNIYAYYIPGILDDVPYYRVFKGRIFVATTGFVDYDPIMKFCSRFVTSTAERDELDIHIKTGRDRWKYIAKERGYKIEW